MAQAAVFALHVEGLQEVYRTWLPESSENTCFTTTGKRKKWEGKKISWNIDQGKLHTYKTSGIAFFLQNAMHLCVCACVFIFFYNVPTPCAPFSIHITLPPDSEMFHIQKFLLTKNLNVNLDCKFFFLLRVILLPFTTKKKKRKKKSKEIQHTHTSGFDIVGKITWFIIHCKALFILPC